MKEKITLTRTFGLVPLSKNDIVSPALFEKIPVVMNGMIDSGSSLGPGWFLGSGMEDVKLFHDKVKHDASLRSIFNKSSFKERVFRCAAQSSYTNLQGYHWRLVIIPAILKTLQANSLETMKENKFITPEFLEDTRTAIDTVTMNKKVRDALLGKIKRGKVSFPKDERKKKALVDEIKDSMPGKSVMDSLLDEDNMDKLDPDCISSSWLPPGLLDREYLSNLARNARNIIRNELFKKHGSKVLAEFQALNNPGSTGRSQLVSTIASELESELVSVPKNWMRDLSTGMTKRVKAINAKHAGNQARIKDSGEHHLDSTISEILETHGIGAVLETGPVILATWQEARIAWRNKKIAWLHEKVDMTNAIKVVDALLDDVIKALDPRTAVNALFRSRKIPGYRNLIPSDTTFDNVIREKVFSLAINRLGLAAWHKLDPLARDILDSISREPERYISLPRIKRAHLPLGPDDSKVYTHHVKKEPLFGIVTSSTVDVSLQPREKLKFKIGEFSIHRMTEMFARGFKLKRGTLTRKTPGGGLLLHAAFQQELEMMKNPFAGVVTKIVRVAGVDLGMKHLAWLSIVDCLKEANVHGYLQRVNDEIPDIARHVIDQFQLQGPRDSWFLQESERKATGDKDFTGEPPNFKRKLSAIFMHAKNLQAKISSLVEKHGSRKKAKNMIEFQKTRRELKRYWKKIRHVHEEMAVQVATRIVSACDNHDVQVIRFEDLSWSKHSSKRKGGYWLSSWQIHWFHGRIQAATTQLARVAGIAVEKVNAENTSKRCSNCQKKGLREGKTFTCTNPGCEMKLDSDLNAARNVAVAPRSKRRNSFIAALIPPILTA